MTSHCESTLEIANASG